MMNERKDRIVRRIGTTALTIGGVAFVLAYGRMVPATLAYGIFAALWLPLLLYGVLRADKRHGILLRGCALIGYALWWPFVADTEPLSREEAERQRLEEYIALLNNSRSHKGP